LNKNIVINITNLYVILNRIVKKGEENSEKEIKDPINWIANVNYKIIIQTIIFHFLWNI